MLFYFFLTFLPIFHFLQLKIGLCPTFTQFLNQFQLKYPKKQTQYRQKIYLSNITLLIKQPNISCSINMFFADTQDEINKKTGRGTLILPPNIDDLAQKQTKIQSSFYMQGQQLILKLSSPSSLDWRQRGAVTPSKVQGGCGVCWSFATIGMCQSSLILQGKASNKIRLSQQYLLKCTIGGSCGGGFLQKAIDKVVASGLPQQSLYPYDPYGISNGICQSTNLIKITNKTRQSKYMTNDDTIISMLQDGPIAIAISATGWQRYSSGIFSCNSYDSVNHAVLLIGYTPDSWIIKNSWGPKFGDKGVIYISRKQNANCGVGVAVHRLEEITMLFTCFLMILILVL